MPNWTFLCPKFSEQKASCAPTVRRNYVARPQYICTFTWHHAKNTTNFEANNFKLLISICSCVKIYVSPRRAATNLMATSNSMVSDYRKT